MLSIDTARLCLETEAAAASSTPLQTLQSDGLLRELFTSRSFIAPSLLLFFTVILREKSFV